MSRGPYPILLMLAMSLPGAARALGLGDIRIDSALNEPLSAQIDIVGATREELIALTAKVANREVFQRYGADRPSFLSSATFRVGVDSQGRPVLNVRSAESFTDPVVSFLVDLRWGNGELIREYSLLLDPSGFGPTRLATALPAMSDRRAGDRSVSDPPVSDRPMTGSVPAAAPATAGGIDPRAAVMTREPRSRATPARDTFTPAPTDGAFAARHVVASGETLRGIVRRAGAGSEPHAQRMMIAVFRANPHAFEGNINVLHVGAVLSLPSGSEVDVISAAEARREVRAQMAAWRLDGRPAAARRLASAPSPASAPHAGADARVSPDEVSAAAALQGRVQSLEQALNDLHKQLASDSATLENLKNYTAQASAQAPTAHAADPAATAPAAAAPAVPAAPPAAAVSATPVVVASTPAAAPRPAPAPTPASVDVAVTHADPRPATILAAVAPPNSEPSFSKGWTGLIAGGIALLAAGFAFGRRRVEKAWQTPNLPERGPDHADTQVIMPDAMPGPSREIHPAPLPPVVEPAAFRPDEADAPAAQHLFEPVSKDHTTQELAIDAEALERSYLDALTVDSLGIDTADTARNATGDLRPENDPAAHDAYAHGTARDDTSANDTTGLETVAVDISEFDATLNQQALNTAIIDRPMMDPSANPTNLDYNLLDLDATAERAEEVHMPSQLTDHAVFTERRMNIADVLKTAIDRDPNRRDLRMKLLETHYTAAAVNRRAFLDIVKYLSRQRDLLSAEDWKLVVKMGREIAPEDILFADSDSGDLAHCA